MDEMEFDDALRRSDHFARAQEEIVEGVAELNCALLRLLIAKDAVTEDEVGFVLEELKLSFAAQRSGSLMIRIVDATLSIFARAEQGDELRVLRELLRWHRETGKPLWR